MNSRCTDCNYEGCRCDRPPMPAAGCWRYDVENAPLDTQLLCWQETPDECDWHYIGMKRIKENEWECGLPGCIHDAPIAFATINPPEIPNHA